MINIKPKINFVEIESPLLNTKQKMSTILVPLTIPSLFCKGILCQHFITHSWFVAFVIQKQLKCFVFQKQIKCFVFQNLWVLQSFYAVGIDLGRKYGVNLTKQSCFMKIKVGFYLDWVLNWYINFFSFLI